jgi:hypothetical protein
MVGYKMAINVHIVWNESQIPECGVVTAGMNFLEQTASTCIIMLAMKWWS